MGVLKALKDLDVKQALYMLNQSIHLMGVIVEKLDEISMKLDRRREEDNDNEEGRDA